MPTKRADPRQKPKPSKQVLAMVEAIRAKKAAGLKRVDFDHVSALIAKPAKDNK